MKNIFYSIIVMLLLFMACQPPEVGYISNDIHSTQDTIFVPRGVFTIGATPAIEGSTYPLHWEITGVTDAQGNPTNDLFDEYELLVWKSSFNADTDTTLALVNEKLKLGDFPSILINDVSGELAFTQATKQITSDNNIYHINVKASNVRGERQLDNYVVVKMEPFKPVEFLYTMYSVLQLGKGGGAFSSDYRSSIANDFDPDVPSVLDGTHPYISITKIDDEPKLGIKVKMVIADSHDTPLNPEKVIFYPNGSSYYQNYHDNSIETTTDATATYFELPAPPFPQYARNFGGDAAYVMYYLTTDDAFTVDKEAYEADNGTKDWSPYIDPDTGEIRNRGFVRWGIKINDTGTWEIKKRIPYTTVK